MRWISYFILAYLALGLQSGISRAMDYHGSGPNFVLMAVVFIALNAPRDPALLGGFILGALQDLTSQGTMGLYSFSYGLVAMFVGSARQVAYREHPLTHFSLTLGGGLMTALVLFVHGWLKKPHVSLMPLVYTAIYSAVLSVIVLGILQRMKSLFHFQSSRQGKWAGISGRP